MGKKVCPVCDQVMHSSRYCRICKAWVTPYEREVNYYLNERHPMSEENCSYHDIPGEERNQPVQSMAKPFYPESLQEAKSEPVFSPSQMRQEAKPVHSPDQTQPESRPNPFTWLKWVIIILIFVNFVLPAMGILFSFVRTAVWRML